MVCKRIYEFKVKFKDQKDLEFNPNIRIIGSNFHGALYKLYQWINENKLTLLEYELVGDHNAWE